MRCFYNNATSTVAPRVAVRLNKLVFPRCCLLSSSVQHDQPKFELQVLEGADLDFSRYGENLFEVLFAGGRLAGGGNVVDEGKKLDTHVRIPTTSIFEALSIRYAVNGIVRPGRGSNKVQRVQIIGDGVSTELCRKEHVAAAGA